MAVRQYVGARYVPKFYQNSQNPQSSEWEDNVAYEALTVVTYNNSSYTSKIPVPSGVGNPASNPNYWVVTGNYNAQVEQYRQETEKVVSGLQTETTNRENADTALENKIAEETTARENEFNALPNAYAPVNGTWKNHNVLMLGDSYAVAMSDPKQNWPWLVAHFLGLDDEHYHNIAVSGAYFYGDGTGSNTFLAQLQNYQGDRNAITDILIAGGLNDSFNIADSPELNLAMYNFAVYANENYPNARRELAFIGNALDDSSVLADRNVEKRIACIANYSNYGRTNGFTILNGTEYALCGGTNMFGGDRLHPSADGEHKIAIAIAQALLTGNNEEWISQRPIYGTPFYMIACNNNATIYTTVAASYMSLPEATPLGSEWVTSAELQNDYFNYPVVLPASMQIDNATGIPGVYASAYGEIQFYHNKMQIRVRKVNEEGTGWYSYVPKSGTGLYIVVPEITHNFPTLFMN